MTKVIIAFQVFEDDCSVISDNPPVVSPEPSENEKKLEKPVLSRAPSIDEVENIEMDSEKEKEGKVNGETEKGDNVDLDKDVESLKDLEEEDEEIQIKSVVENPDLRRESIAEIKRLAENIVQKGEGRGLLCSVDSANMNLNGSDMRSSIDEPQESLPYQPSEPRTSVIVTNPSVDLAASGSPASEGTTGKILRSSIVSSVFSKVNFTTAFFLLYYLVIRIKKIVLF